MLIHLVSGTGFAILAVFTFVWRQRRTPVGPLAAACLLNALWSFGQFGLVLSGNASIVLIIILDMARAMGWLWFAASLLPPARAWAEGRLFRLATIGLPLSILVIVVFGLAVLELDGSGVQGIFVFGSLAISVTGLIVLEQAYRNTPEESRWSIKMLILGIGTVFAYDLFLFSHALLFGGINLEHWMLRGPVNLLTIPLLIIGARRYQPLGLDVFVSRQVVFFSTTLLGTGTYLLIMAAAGYYLREVGGEWGRLIQVAFLVGAMIVLAVVLMSSTARNRIKVFLAKHFYANRYDYREQWLALTQALIGDAGGQSLGRRSLRAIGAIARSNSGAIWMENPRSHSDVTLDYVAMDYWNTDRTAENIPADSSFIDWLKQRMWVVDTEDLRRHPEKYDQLVLPDWMGNFGQHQIIVPLIADGRMCGLIVLSEPELGPHLDFEDIDLLKAAGSQIAAVMRQYQSNELLAENRQFEAYNRLTAFLIHDLSNLIAQQSLVVRNSARFKHEPEFIDDVIETVDNSVRRMERLLEQLRQGRIVTISEKANLATIAEDAASRVSNDVPKPEMGNVEDLYVITDREALVSMVGHVIRNAQHACDPGTGKIKVSVIGNKDQAEIQVEDNGSGMDETFVRQRLFRPFDSTKGSKGMGIGAYQVREFVEQTGGSVRVDSEPGHGTVFSLCFPVVSATQSNTEPETNDQSDERKPSDGIA